MSGNERYRVVITGLGLVTPVGIGADEFWTNLTSGTSGIAEISSFDASSFAVRIAGEVTAFEPGNWLRAGERRRLDRVAQLAIAAGDMALDQRGLGDLDRGRVSTVVTSAMGGTASIETACASYFAGGKVSPFFIPSAMANAAGSALAHRHGLGGPSSAPVTACASSSDSIGQGYRLVRDGYAAACLAGGSEACINPIILSGFSSMRTLSKRNEEPERASRPFDAQRDGFVLSEGAAVLVLETLESARASGAHVYAEVLGYGQTNDSFHVTAPRPDGLSASNAMLAALDESELPAERIDYVNAHGTGTELSDVAETAAIKRTFGEHARSVPVSSTKSMTGHLLGAAGAVEAAACALGLDQGWVPPTINHEVADADCDLDYVPKAARRVPLRAAMSNSFAFGGHNISLVFGRVDEQEE